MCSGFKNTSIVYEMADPPAASFLHALENESNASIMSLTTLKIKEHKNNVLQQLQLPRDKLKQYHRKLKQYRYVRGMHDLQYGHYIRWIPLNDPECLDLTNGAHICDIKIVNNQIQVLCKNGLHHFFQIKYDENVIFQKLSDQERVILGVLDYLEK